MPNLTITIGDEEHTVTARYEVCHRCQGEGIHDHPAFSNGITAEEFREDPDFHEDYMDGHYDVACEECAGLRVILTPDRTTITADLLRQMDEDASEIAHMNAIMASERRMGA